MTQKSSPVDTEELKKVELLPDAEERLREAVKRGARQTAVTTSGPVRRAAPIKPKRRQGR